MKGPLSLIKRAGLDQCLASSQAGQRAISVLDYQKHPTRLLRAAEASSLQAAARLAPRVVFGTPVTVHPFGSLSWDLGASVHLPGARHRAPPGAHRARPRSPEKETCCGTTMLSTKVLQQYGRPVQVSEPVIETLSCPGRCPSVEDWNCHRVWDWDWDFLGGENDET